MRGGFLAGLGAGVVIAAAGALALSPLKAEGTATADTYRQLDLFANVFERVRADYVEPVDDGALIDSAINGMLVGLDPHSSYLNAKNYRDMQVQTKGEFGGLGIEVTMEDGVVKVVTPIDDTPAARAGLKAGDIITELDGEPISGLSLNEAVDRMRGPVNTQISLTIARQNVKEPITVKLTRDIIRIQSVKYRAEGNIGYIRITTFNEQTQDGVEKAVSSLEKSLGGKLSGFVLDLRNNPGGLLEQAVHVSDDFLDEGEIVSTRGRKPDDIERYNAHRGDLIDGKPLVVLVNGGSASASEIVAGALQDHRRATLVGTRSFGKGSVQTIIPLGGGLEGAIRLTTARYYTPSGRSIQAKGIDPDIEVRLPDAKDKDKDKNAAIQLRSEADLPGHLKAVEGEEHKEIQAGPVGQGPSDIQLTYALNLLHGVETAGKSVQN
jgi:carboxyl-terminal processing protease